MSIEISSTTTRFAPSPTGFLHLGHVYAAQFARDLALSQNGTFLLRFEDIDTTRVKEHYYAAILEDLAWLGILHQHTPLRQTTRQDAYNQALQRLQQRDVIYPCFCTRKQIQKELSQIAHAPHTTGNDASHYPQTCRSLSKTLIVDYLDQGIAPAWRINTDRAYQLTGELAFTDLHHGSIPVQHHVLGDAILSRKDIGSSYHLAVVVDDAFQSITHVTRGNDLLPSTHLHRVLQALLDLPFPTYKHHRLITDQSGQRLAKRSYTQSVRGLRQQGHSPKDVLKLMHKALL